MFSSLLASMIKEWKKMLEDKMIYIVILILPILVNILLGFVLAKNQIQNIPMAVVDEDNSSLSRMIVQQFRENEIFNIKYDLSNSSEIERLIDSSKVKVGMVIPNGFEKDIKVLKSPTIMMLYDGSHMSIASTAKSRASEILMTLKTGTLIKLLEGMLNLSAEDAKRAALGISFGSRTLYNPTKSFKLFLLPGLGMAIIQTGIALMGAVSVRRIELEKGIEKRAGYIVGKVLFYSIIGTFSSSICIFIQNIFFKVPLRGDFVEIVLLSFFFLAAVAAFSIMVSAWIRNEMIASMINAVVFIPSTIMVGYTWPVLSMPQIYRFAAGLQPFYHFADNLRDLLLKGSTSSPITNDLFWFLRFITVIIPIAIIGAARLKGEVTENEKAENEEAILEENSQLAFNESAN